ncbi:lipopolysaccharide biosynthesis protein [Desulfofarcimen acetoxidans DSM 771]|uniref:Lipopolysaccharide biosynthesis protein n=1 Tax=Desulfofarcimen acetoxidans (strain ATCC 49208 / DSM 771 / KCTC 5769 / VKM B-1644 / 5575) TaxID=485916 RepID=C8W2D7_DESAS|nr:GNVR domain-containing protein [Desulfofarcimen acetoxidans]ACV63621.1 lipopolysaccharide biosynthesis protein [Desulfofarcimen acetoxidans DSM 771]
MRAKEVAKALGEIKLALLAVPILAMIISAVISSTVLSPVFKASTTLMVFKQSEVAVPYEVSIGTITLNQKIVKTYAELARSTLILEEVIKQNELKMSIEDLRQKVNVELLGDTEFLKISVESSNPTMSAMLANSMAKVLLEKVADILNFDNLRVVDAASPPSSPIWPNRNLNVLLAGILGLVLVFGVALFRTSLRNDSGEASNVPQIILHPISPSQAVMYQSVKTNETCKNSGQDPNQQ